MTRDCGQYCQGTRSQTHKETGHECNGQPQTADLYVISPHLLGEETQRAESIKDPTTLQTPKMDASTWSSTRSEER
ncbi:unnamed protein product [Staurois parvus]|uniref:Uncharacterized protein n=1 Tax=Staurois parvus TaxID=386267 RepID=A0ABN9BJM1_9NEOB|nr:unnamed protein product [Staurois parvus]